jgi:hypothetical protein
VEEFTIPVVESQTRTAPACEAAFDAPATIVVPFSLKAIELPRPGKEPSPFGTIVAVWHQPLGKDEQGV